MKFTITGEETGDQLIKQLVALRFMARRLLRLRKTGHQNLKRMRNIAEEDPASPEAIAAQQYMVEQNDLLLSIKFEILEIGHYTMDLCHHLDEKADRTRVLDALNVGLAARRSDELKEHGSTTSGLIFVAGLEDSSERDGEDWGFGPLGWCCQMAFMQMMRTNEKFDRVIHDGLNDFFGGAFGEYRERPLLERLAGHEV